MVPVFLLVVGIGILLILSLFFIPVRAQVALGNAPAPESLVAQASWAGIGARMRKEGGETRQELLLGGHPFYTFAPKADQRQPPGAEEEKEEMRILSLLRRTPHLLRLIRPLCGLGREILRRTTLEEVRGRITIGFRDPAETGILFGWYWALLPLLSCSRLRLEVTPAFDREVLDGEVMARVRIDRPLLLMLATARLFLDRDVRAALSGLREA